MPRSQTIDILRALAILLVLGRHIERAPLDDFSGLHLLVGGLTEIWHRGGWIGVDLFFVLSGFLVSGLLFSEHQRFGSLSGKDFLIRRGLKIYPAFWILLGVTGALAVLRDNFHPAPFLSELLFFQNYGPSVWNHTWSLAVEEHFYILLLLFLIFLSRRTAPNPFRSIPYAFAALAAISLLVRFATSYPAPFSYKTHLFPSHLRMDSLFCGVVISYYYHYHADRFFDLAKRLRVPLLILGMLALAPAFVFELKNTPWMSVFGFTLVYLGSGLILIAAVTLHPAEHRIVTSAAYMGSHSYSIYLWHMPVVAWVLPRAARLLGEYWTWSLHFVVYVVGAISLGILMALLIEFPVLKARDRWFPSRARPLKISYQPPDKDLRESAPPVAAL
jgi:peptidoglycan/LPS O-acetylase OafA/YrhL